MSEQEPSMRLTMHGEKFEATPDNTSLFMFAGNLALYNHVFVVTKENEAEGTAEGTYVFWTHQVYETMRDYMMQNGYPIHANLRHLAQCDLDAYENMIKQQIGDVGDTVPDEWGE